MVALTDLILFAAATVFFAGVVSCLVFVYRKQESAAGLSGDRWRTNRRLFEAGCVLTVLALDLLAAQAIFSLRIPTVAGICVTVAAVLPVAFGLVRLFEADGVGG